MLAYRDTSAHRPGTRAGAVMSCRRFCVWERLQSLYVNALNKYTFSGADVFPTRRTLPLMLPHRSICTCVEQTTPQRSSPVKTTPRVREPSSSCSKFATSTSLSSSLTVRLRDWERNLGLGAGSICRVALSSDRCGVLSGVEGLRDCEWNLRRLEWKTPVVSGIPAHTYGSR